MFGLKTVSGQAEEQVMGRLHGSWIWYELMTPDPAGAKAFYDAVLGWNIQPGTDETGGYGFIANPDGGLTGGILALTPEQCAEGAEPAWMGYIGVDDCDAAVTAITAAGGACLSPPVDEPMAGRIALVTDPQGQAFYVMTPAPPPGESGESTAFSPELPGRCGWNELATPDQPGALAFYTGVMGWDLPEALEMGPLGTYQFLEHDGTGIGAIFAAPPETPTGWTFYFRVTDIEAARERLLAAGGEILQDLHEVPGDDWIIAALDPQGAAFALVGHRA